MKCIERYRFFRRTPIFNHEELLMRLSEAVIRAFETVVMQGRDIKRKHAIKNAEARKMFQQTTTQSATTTAVSSLHSTAQRNQQLSLARFEDVWYFAAWLLHQLQELVSREVAGRNALLSLGTLRGKLWLADQTKNSKLTGSNDPKRQSFVPLAIGSVVSATWKGNPAFNSKAPTDPALCIWYDGTIIGWNGVTGDYAVRFHADGLVDEHVLPKHVKPKGGAAGGSKTTHNEWLTYQACLDGEEGGQQQVSDGSRREESHGDGGESGRGSKMSFGDGASTSIGMKKKLKKSAVDFAPAQSNIVACAICRHALYLSCVRCSCCPEKASCLLHAQELCACKGESKTIYVRYTVWQLHNVLAAIQQIVNHRNQKKTETTAQVARDANDTDMTPAVADGATPDAAAATSTPASVVLAPIASSSRRHPAPRAAYNPFTDSYETSGSADDFALLPGDDARPYPMLGTEPPERSEECQMHPLAFSTNFPIFSMGIDEHEDETPVDMTAAATSEAGCTTAAVDASATVGIVEKSDAPVDDRVPSTRALASILSESRRIMYEPDDYVMAVGLRDEKLAKAAAASAAVDEGAQRGLEARLMASTQGSAAHPRQSIHHSTLRSAVRFSHPTSAPAVKDVSEALKLKLRKDADAWIARYGGWITQAEKTKAAYDADQLKLATEIKLSYFQHSCIPPSHEETC
jgi:hypothetical protein